MSDELDLDPEAEEFIRVLCSFLSDALESALEEAEETEYSYEEPDPLSLVQKHIAKKLDYMEAEGWIDRVETADD